MSSTPRDQYLAVCAELQQCKKDLAAAQMDAAKTGEREAVYLSRIQHLMSELEAARADAERYRWIRDNHEVRGRAMEIVYGMNGSDWDAAIDAAQAQDAE